MKKKIFINDSKQLKDSLGLTITNKFLNEGYLLITLEDKFQGESLDTIYDKLVHTLSDAEILVYQPNHDTYYFPIFNSPLTACTNCVSILLLGDSEFTFFERDLALAYRFDHTIIYSDKISMLYKYYEISHSVLYTPYDWKHFDNVLNGYGASSYTHKLLENKYDISYIGLCIKNTPRHVYLEKIRKENFNFIEYSSGTYQNRISYDHMISIYNNTKISLVFTSESRPLSKSILSFAQSKVFQAKGKITEIALAGGFALVEYYDGLDNYYKIGVEIDIFRDYKELIEKINYYLENTAERSRMSNNLYSKAIKNYTIDLFYESIYNIIHSLVKTNKPSLTYADSYYSLNQIIFDIKRAFIQFKLRNFKKAFRILKYHKIKNLFFSFLIVILKKV